MRSAGPPLPILALLAGGRGTRLAPLTEKIPKSMVEVAGEPFIAHQLRGYKGEGVRRVVICAGILAEQIEAYLGDGSRFGLEVAFSLDGPKPLGTGGALRKALPLLDDYFLVTYGDTLLDVRIPAMVGAFLAAGKPGLMTVLRNENQWDRSNVNSPLGAFTDMTRPTPLRPWRTLTTEWASCGGRCWRKGPPKPPSTWPMSTKNWRVKERWRDLKCLGASMKSARLKGWRKPSSSSRAKIQPTRSRGAFNPRPTRPRNAFGPNGCALRQTGQAP